MAGILTLSKLESSIRKRPPLFAGGRLASSMLWKTRYALWKVVVPLPGTPSVRVLPDIEYVKVIVSPPPDIVRLPPDVDHEPASPATENPPFELNVNTTEESTSLTHVPTMLFPPPPLLSSLLLPQPYDNARPAANTATNHTDFFMDPPLLFGTYASTPYLCTTSTTKHTVAQAKTEKIVLGGL